MSTAKEEYIASLNEITTRYGKMEDTTIRELFREMDTLRKQINQRIADSAGDPGLLQRQKVAIDALIADFESKYTSQLQTSTGAALTDGAQAVVQPLSKIGVQSALFTPSLAQLNTLNTFSAELIQGITGDLRKAVNFQVAQTALGQQTPFKAMQNVTAAFGQGKVDRQGNFVANGVTAKAERDIRTELQRIFNLSEHSQQLKTAETEPGLLKRWIATADNRTRPGHLEAHNRYRQNPIPIKEKYLVYDISDKGVKRGSALLAYPTDPSAPPQYTVNCRCSESTIHPLVGVIGSSLDGRIASQLKRRTESHFVYTQHDILRTLRARETVRMYWMLRERVNDRRMRG